MGDSNSRPNRGTILLIDSQLDQLRILAQILQEKGFSIQTAINSSIAIALAKMQPPELILISTDTVELASQGYHACRRFKAESKTQAIPIIFLSVLNTTMAKVQAFGAGAVDYIIRPFQIAEVVARVETHITLRRLQIKTEAQNQLLQEQIVAKDQALRDRALAEAKYRSIFENAIEGIYQITPTGRFLSANPALARIYGYDSAAELMAQLVDLGNQLYVRPRRRDELVTYMSQFGDLNNFESEIYRKDGSRIWISESIRAVQDEAGNLLNYEGSVQDITERRQAEEELRRQRTRAERLLLNILPQPIAERLKQKPVVVADMLPDVTILFADLVNFTQLVAHMPPQELVQMLNRIFSEFDHLAERYAVEKVKTIGDAYMVAGGAPLPAPGHADAIANMALSMQSIMGQFQPDTKQPLQLRIGINTGPVVAGVIGTRKFTYDLWGNTVNIASRMESQGVPGRIQITEATYRRLQKNYDIEYRGRIMIKGQGETPTYWLLGRKSTL
jgi:PAS domain S-box-containing protein